MPSKRGSRGTVLATTLQRSLLAAVLAGVLALVAAVLPATMASAAASRAGIAPHLLPAIRATLQDPGATAEDNFGSAVAVSGVTAVVGSDVADNLDGVAYVYVKGTTGWPTTPTVILANPSPTPDASLFGTSVAVAGNTIVVGSYGNAYVYVNRGSGWPSMPTATLTDPTGTASGYFGYSVAVSGAILVVGDFGANDFAGTTFIYTRHASTWPATPNVTLPDPGATADDYFGYSVALYNRTVVVGAFLTDNLTGTAYVYVKTPGAWPTTPTTTLEDPGETDGDRFGYSVAVSGTTVVIGAIGVDDLDGAAYIYVNSASGWPATPNVTLPDPAATSQDLFGVSVGVSGSTVVAGVDDLDANSGLDAGTAYVYLNTASSWPATPTYTLQDPAATAGDIFGDSVAATGKTVVAGAPNTNAGEGEAYIFKV